VAPPETRPAPAPAVVEAPIDPYAELLAGAPSQPLRDAKAYILDPKTRLGVYVGLPEGWRYDDPSYLSITPRKTDDAGRFALVRLSDAQLGDANLAQVLARGVVPAQIKSASWGKWHDGVAGRARWPAKIARGQAEPVIARHGRQKTLAAVIAVPDTPAVGVVAAWPEDTPEMEAIMLDIVRHLHRCKIRVGHGCEAD
jgi:hypothetical protein